MSEGGCCSLIDGSLIFLLWKFSFVGTGYLKGGRKEGRKEGGKEGRK